MPFSVAGISSYIVLIIQLPVMASLSVFCRRVKKKNDFKEGIVLTKDASKEAPHSRCKLWHNPRPPPNVPVAPPPKDPLDDTLKGVKSLVVERSAKGGRPR
ncbi:hypothetical protein RB195_000529 [Necator americanus]|uniref:Uncharacterized protein n=1 Tax=Necator americanus TaxID=51031 RepID=A0ABR1DD72_NECAM